jgi:hypothetical protein
MEALLDLTPIWLAATVCGLSFGFALIVYLLAARSPLASRVQEFRCVPMGVVSAIAILFGLFSAFLGADIWERSGAKLHSIEGEIAAVQTLGAIAGDLGEHGVRVKRSVSAYIDVDLLKKPKDSSLTHNPLDELLQDILDLAQTEAAHAPARSEMLVAYHEIKLARAQRLRIEGQHGDPSKWLVVIFMGFLMQIAIVFERSDRPKGQIAGLAIFSSAFAITVIALAVHEAPLAQSSNVLMEVLSHSAGG